jgi:hypothetical protein
MRRFTSFTSVSALLCAAASAQVTRYEGPSPNLTTILNFDTPPAPSGPIASSSTVFTSVGITSVTLIGTAFTASGDTLTAGSNVNGQCLVVRNGVLTVAGPGAPLDTLGAGTGFDVRLASPVDEFQARFVDDLNMDYDVELFLGATSLGVGQFVYLNPTFPFGAHYWRAGASQFNRIRITFPQGAPGIGLDELAFGNGAAPTPPVNNECNVSPLLTTLGMRPFDTTNSTRSARPWSCAPTSGADIWYRFQESVTRMVEFSTCGSTFDTSLEISTGSCTTFTPLGCNDNACGTGASVTVMTTAGTIYFIRIGGIRGDTGAGTLTIRDIAAPPNCLVTTFLNNNGGNVGGAIYFDLAVTQNVRFSGLELNSGTAVGTPAGITVYTTPGTHVGNEADIALWTPVAEDDGTSFCAGAGLPTAMTFVAPFDLTPGSYGVAIVGTNGTTGFSQAHAYTNGTATNTMVASPDGVLTLMAGAALNVPFTGAPLTPRVWNGRLCYSAGSFGSNYCTPAVPNSTGASASMGAMGSAVVSQNSLVLDADSLPLSSFGFFLTSRTQGFVAMPGGSRGNLCLGSGIGRYVGPGQIMNSGATGAISLAVDLTAHPQPTGSVMVVPGDTWNFQAWYRDSVMGQATSNFTDGLEIVFF